jgi:hypothetical protein
MNCFIAAQSDHSEVIPNKRIITGEAQENGDLGTHVGRVALQVLPPS